MAPEKPEKTPAPKPKSRRLISPWFADIFAGLSSVAAAAGMAWSQIEKAAYANVSALWAFESMKYDRHDRFLKEVKEPYIFEQLDKDEVYRLTREAIQSNSPDIAEAAKKELAKMEKAALQEGLKHELEKGLVIEDKLVELRNGCAAVAQEGRYNATKEIIGMNEKNGATIMRKVVGADSILKRWGLLRTHQKIETVIFAGAAAGVALATLLPASRENFTAEQLDEIARKAAELNADKQAQPQR